MAYLRSFDLQILEMRKFHDEEVSFIEEYEENSRNYLITYSEKEKIMKIWDSKWI